ncbi:MAG: hypothetical protein LBT37_00465 [Lactobacillaceae bacterium]|jgi:hypothetical protein|nr:hypothetical protein [Lactobacillaceae bacterium]
MAKYFAISTALKHALKGSARFGKGWSSDDRIASLIKPNTSNRSAILFKEQWIYKMKPTTQMKNERNLTDLSDPIIFS